MPHVFIINSFWITIKKTLKFLFIASEYSISLKTKLQLLSKNILELYKSYKQTYMESCSYYIVSP